MAASNSAFQRRYPPEMRERAVRMVREAIAESGERVGVVTRMARQLGIGPESLRNWVFCRYRHKTHYADVRIMPTRQLARTRLVLKRSA
jgi:transposase-like protein